MSNEIKLYLVTFHFFIFIRYIIIMLATDSSNLTNKKPVLD